MASTYAKTVRSQLKLRCDTLTGEWELWTTTIPNTNFKWFKVSSDTAEWYRTNFPAIKVEHINVPNFTSGALQND